MIISFVKKKLHQKKVLPIQKQGVDNYTMYGAATVPLHWYGGAFLEPHCSLELTGKWYIRLHCGDRCPEHVFAVYLFLLCLVYTHKGREVKKFKFLAV